jgi:L-rhamnose mutarotase
VERVCFPGRIQPDRLAEYRRRHGEVWPEMLDARIDEIFHLDEGVSPTAPRSAAWR